MWFDMLLDTWYIVQGIVITGQHKALKSTIISEGGGLCFLELTKLYEAKSTGHGLFIITTRNVALTYQRNGHDQ